MNKFAINFTNLTDDLKLSNKTDNLRRYRNIGGAVVDPVSGDDGSGAARDDGGGAQHRQDARRLQDLQLQQRLQGGEGRREGVKCSHFGISGELCVNHDSDRTNWHNLHTQIVTKDQTSGPTLKTV